MKNTSSPSPIYEKANAEEGVAARVFVHDRGFSVSLVDTDVEQVVGGFRIYPDATPDRAIAYAASLIR